MPGTAPPLHAPSSPRPAAFLRRLRGRRRRPLPAGAGDAGGTGETGGPPERKPWQRPQRDGVLIALTGLVSGVVLWRLGLYNTPSTGARYGAWLLLPLAVMCLAALGRRSAQPWVLPIAVAAFGADVAMGSLLPTVVIFTDIVYATVMYGPERVSRAVLPVSVAVSVAFTLGLLAVFREPEVLFGGAFCAAVTIVPAWTGVVIRDHRNAASAERLRAEQTALLAEMDRVQAVSAERARMARELHDVVANHLSAIAIHSTAALSFDEVGTGSPVRKDGGTTGNTAAAEPALLEEADGSSSRTGTAAPQSEPPTREALRVIRENSVQGLAEMRHLIGLLREAHDDETPLSSPTLDGLDALVERARNGADGTGLRFTVLDGREPAVAGQLPAPVELAAYRVVQESLTNALKHSGPGDVTVEVTCLHSGTGGLTVRVTNPLTPRRSGSPRAPGSGAGLIGMRERVELLGGELHAGPAQEPGGRDIWEVRAELPVGERSDQ